jgi:phosphatidylglycerophosphatase A
MTPAGATPARVDAAEIIATWFGIGRLPWAPGSWGALAALPFAWIIGWLLGPLVLLAAAIALFIVGWWAASRMSRRSAVKDPGSIVVDEVVGQWLTLVLAPPDASAYAAGFLLFRLFDIWKPWPIGWVDGTLAGGFGIMADDVIAALYAAVALVLLLLVLGKPLA